MRWFTLLLTGFLPFHHGRAQDVANPFIDPIATTVQLPTFGVSFDAQGVLQVKTFTDPTGKLARQRALAARARLPGKLAVPVKTRYVSLARLERAVLRRRDDGEEPSDAMQRLAGLTRVTSIFCYPDSGEILLAGPAEPWADDLSGRTVGIHSGRPTLLLDDLVVALRAYQPDGKAQLFVGCTINPQAEGLAKLQAFQRTIPRSIPQRSRQVVTQQIARGVKESLGMAAVQVFGISPQTHMARVMIEADYRMKRIAIGVEAPPVPMVTFASAMTTAQHGALQRWWLTPAYDGVRASPDRLAMRLDGQGVRLQTENKEILRDGTIVDAVHSKNRATTAFAVSFTKRYGDVAHVRPVYAQLRQVVDFLIVAAFMQRHDWHAKVGWTSSHFLDSDAFPVATYAKPSTAPVVVNAFWKQNRMFTPAGGGVSIQADKAIAKPEEDASLNQTRAAQRISPDEAAWWWDATDARQKR